MPKGWDGWDEVSQEDCERLIARLIIEEADRHGWKYEDRTGNGADDGADVLVYEPAGLHIYEIKRFRKERLGSSQRSQIKHSLSEALKHDPIRWTLAIPINPTVGERKWLHTLEGSVPLDWMPRNDLHALLHTRYPHLLRLVQTDYERGLEAIAVFAQEQAVLSNGLPDVQDRVQRLLARANEIDPDWLYTSMQITHDGGFHVMMKSRPGAFTPDRPFTIRWRLKDGEENLLSQIRTVLDEGGMVAIHPDQIESLEIPVAVDPGSPMGLILGSPPEAVNIPLTLQTSDKQHLLAMSVYERQRGAQRAVARARDATGQLVMEVRTPSAAESAEPGTLRMFREEALAASALSALGTARFHLMLAQGEAWTLHHGGTVSHMDGAHTTPDGLDHLEAEVEFLEHMVVVEKTIHRAVAVPATSAPMDRLFAKMLADLILTDRAVLRTSLVYAKWSANAPKQLSTILGGDLSGQFLLTATVEPVTVVNQEIRLPFGVQQSIRAEFADPDAILRHAQRPDDEEIEVGLRVIDKELVYTRDDSISVEDDTEFATPARVPAAPDGVTAGLVMGDSTITPL